MAEFSMKHVRHPAYASTVATGVVMMGPTPDGLVHVTFYRDLAVPVSEKFDREERDIGGGGKEVKMTAVAPADMEQVREDVVTVQIPSHVLLAVATAFNNMKSGVEMNIAMAKEIQANAG